jgi:hypothetical protein
MALLMPTDEKASANAISMDMNLETLTIVPLIISWYRGNARSCGIAVIINERSR